VQREREVAALRRVMGEFTQQHEEAVATLRARAAAAEADVEAATKAGSEARAEGETTG
jgi:hypothetical protein